MGKYMILLCTIKYKHSNHIYFVSSESVYNMSYFELIHAYEAILCGGRKQFHSTYSSNSTNTMAVQGVLYYAVEKILDWEPSEMAQRFTPEMISRLGLVNIANKVPFPPGLERSTDYFYYAEFLYPGTCTEEWKSAALKYYKSYLQKTRNRLPLCCPREHKDIYLFNFLEYAISNFLPVDIDKDDPRALYRFFSSGSIDIFLSRIKLSGPCAIQYLYPIDMFHAYMGSKGTAVSPELYPYYKFRAFMNENNLCPSFLAQS